MQSAYDSMADIAVAKLIASHKHRIIIAIAGVPGSGKTTIASRVALEINSRAEREVSKAVGMDGYHLTRAQLSAMDDPVMAHERRGAPFTFNATGVVQLVKDIIQSGERQVDMRAPSFDHKVKDPVENGILIGRQIRIVLLEGLYLLLKDEPWCEISKLVADKWLVHVTPEIARVRLAERHLKAGIVDTIEQGYARADGNDAANGKYIEENSLKADMEIFSQEDKFEAKRRK
jgi:pantothenate kinase